MQAITTKYLPATNHHGARIRAKCARGSLSIPFSYSGAEHEEAKRALCAKFQREDFAKYGTKEAHGIWGFPTVSGETHKGEMVHVFLPRT